MKRSTPLLLCLALTHASVAAAAETPRTPPRGANGESTTSASQDADDPVRRAQGHFQRGVELYGERNYDGALAEFSRAHELSPNYRVLYNLAQTYFAWIGTGTGDEDVFYYRVHSPVILIEFDHQRGVALDVNEPFKDHIHTVVRTPNGNDYGKDLLRQHYEQYHK